MEPDTEVAAEKPLGLVSMTLSDQTNVGATKTISGAEYRRLIWKLDVHLLPPLFVLWFISLIDRVNIGTARIQGLEKDLGMDPLSNQFNIATGKPGDAFQVSFEVVYLLGPLQSSYSLASCLQRFVLAQRRHTNQYI